VAEENKAKAEEDLKARIAESEAKKESDIKAADVAVEASKAKQAAMQAEQQVAADNLALAAAKAKAAADKMILEGAIAAEKKDAEVQKLEAKALEEGKD